MTAEKVEIVAVKITRHEIAIDMGLGEFYPKFILGLLSINRKTIEVIALNKVISLSKKMNIAIPKSKIRQDNLDNETTIIHSIQLVRKNGQRPRFLAEVSGPFDARVDIWIRTIAKTMQKYGIDNAFFPAYANTQQQINIFHGDLHLEDTRRVLRDSAIATVRVLEDHGTLLVSTGRELELLDILHINERTWRMYSKPIYAGTKKIVFLGRFQGQKIPVTFADGETAFFKLSSAEFKKVKLGAVDGQISAAFVGAIDNGLAAIVEFKEGNKENVLSLIPQHILAVAH